MTTIASSNDFTQTWAHTPVARTTENSRREEVPMAYVTDQRQRSFSKFKRAESMEYRAIFIAAFGVFLVAAIAERLLPTRWFARTAGAGRRKTILEQAKDAAKTCAAYAFMG